MKKIFERIYTGNQEDCFKEKENWAVVRVCKFPCHRNAVGYIDKIIPAHINYLFK